MGHLMFFWDIRRLSRGKRTDAGKRAHIIMKEYWASAGGENEKKGLQVQEKSV